MCHGQICPSDLYEEELCLLDRIMSGRVYCLYHLSLASGRAPFLVNTPVMHGDLSRDLREDGKNKDVKQASYLKNIYTIG